VGVKPEVGGVQFKRRDMLSQMHVLSDTQFKEFRGTLFQALGYEMRPLQADSGTGADFELAQGGRLVVVRCKQQQSTQTVVGETAVRDLLGVVTRHGADRGIFCVNGYFSTRAMTWAAGTCIELMDAAEIMRLWSAHADEVSLPAVAQPREWS